MGVVSFREGFNGLFNEGDSSIFSHLLCRVICMAACSIPVSFNWFWVEGNRNIKVFSNSKHEISSQPHMVSDLNAFTGSDLVFPLSGHDFSVCSRYLKSCVKTCSIMSVTHNSSEAGCGAGRAVVRSLRAGKSSVRPPEGPIVNMGSFY